MSALRSALHDLDLLDRSVYTAIAGTPTPTLDVALRAVSTAANYSRLWFGVAGLVAAAGGRSGQAAAVDGLTAIGVSSALANLVLKRVLVRGRPDRAAAAVIPRRQVRMPGSTSFPSGHAASAFAFATAASARLPVVSLPLYLLATTVGYSRVHTGVHYPGDVLAGAVLGASAGELVRRLRRSGAG